MCSRARVSMCGHVFLKIFTFCFQRPTLFLEMALNTKSMKNAYSLFLRVPLFTFQTPEGPFLLLSGRHRRSGCLTGPREAGRRRRNQWGALGGVGFCCLRHSCWQVRPFCLMQSQQAWVSHTHKHADSHRRAHVEEFWLQSRVPMGERGKGPKPLETLTMVGFPKWGYVPYVCTHWRALSHASSITQHLVLSLLKI